MSNPRIFATSTHKALGEYATAGDKRCNLSKAHFLLLQEFLQLHGIALKKVNQSTWYNYEVDLEECDIGDDSQFFQPMVLYRHLEKIFGRSVADLCGSRKKQIRKNMDLKQSIERSTSALSISVLRELDRVDDKKATVTIICIDTDMMADQGLPYLLKEIDRRKKEGEHIFLVKTGDIDTALIKKHSKAPILDLDTSTSAQIVDSIKQSQIPEQSGNLSVITYRINQKVSSLRTRLKPLKTMRAYTISFKQFVDGELQDVVT